MATLHIYWRTADFDPDEQARHRRQVALTGILTDEHEAATTEQPVVVEERAERVYRPAQLRTGEDPEESAESRTERS